MPTGFAVFFVLLATIVAGFVFSDGSATVACHPRRGACIQN